MGPIRAECGFTSPGRRGPSRWSLLLPASLTRWEAGFEEWPWPPHRGVMPGHAGPRHWTSPSSPVDDTMWLSMGQGRPGSGLPLPHRADPHGGQSDWQALRPAARVCVGSLDSALCSPRGSSEAHLGWIRKLLCLLTCHPANSKLVHLALQDLQGGSPGGPAALCCQAVLALRRVLQLGVGRLQ